MRTLAGLLLAAACAFAGDPVHLIVLHTNDLHGQLMPHPASPARAVLRGKPAGGFPHLVTMVRNIREQAAREGAKVLLFSAGDIFQGTPVGNETRGDAVIACMRLAGYDAMAVGNHEFDYGVENMFRLAKAAPFPVLAANMGPIEGTSVAAWTKIEAPDAPCTIAVIGLITPMTPLITSPAVGERFKFADPVATARGLVKEIDADLHFVLSHCGRDVELRIAREVEGVALVAGGHSHTPVQRVIGTVPYVQTHGKSYTLGRVDLWLDPDGWKVLRAKTALLPVDPSEHAADPEVQAIVDRYGKVLEKKLAVVVGELAAPARRARGLFSSSAGNWMADVVRDVGRAEIGITNKGGIRTDLEPGKVTMGDVYRLMPFENTIVTMKLTGADVRKLVERHVGLGGEVRAPGLEWSGMRVVLKSPREIQAILVGGAPLDPERTYLVATNSFLSWGGDGFEAFRRGAGRAETGVLFRDALAADLRKRSPVKPPAERRIVVAVAAR
jgi:2',3'-cyclic-nucleotide 2'-phosphodiesterase (5'-nucleotidase family)